MKPTDRTITFVEGHNQFGPNSLSTVTVFVDDSGVEYIANRSGGYAKISDVNKPVHDSVDFLKKANQKTGIPVPEPVMAEAVKTVNRSANPSNPVYKLDENGRLQKLREL